MPPPPPPIRPPAVHSPQHPTDIPWYLERPNRAPPSAPPVTPSKPTAPPAQPSTATDLRRYLPWLLLAAGGIAVAIGAAVLIDSLSRLDFTGGTVLDVTKVQSGVLQILSDPASGYGANTVTDVSCNGGRNPSAHKGTTFTCDATVNGSSRHVSVLVADDRGTYEVDAPR
jgi:hypothetical protein